MIDSIGQAYYKKAPAYCWMAGLGRGRERICVAAASAIRHRAVSNAKLSWKAVIRAAWDARKAAGVNQAALDEAARMGFALGEFEECEEDGAAVVEEFYPSQAADAQISDGEVRGELPLQPSPRVQGLQASLKQKLAQKSSRALQDAATPQG